MKEYIKVVAALCLIVYAVALITLRQMALAIVFDFEKLLE